MREQAEELQAIFVGHARVLGGETPVMDEDIALVEADGQVGVAEVNGEEHGG